MLLCVGLLFGAMALRDATNEGQAARAETRSVAPLLVRVMPVDPSDGYDNIRTFVGRVEAARETMASFELQGLAVEVGPDAGDLVSEGDVLAKLDTSRLKATENELLARLKQSQADVALAKQTFSRTREARELDAVAQQALDDAQRQLDTANAAVEVAEASLEGVRVDLKKSTLVAPFDAIVAERRIDEGAVVSPGQVAFELLDRQSPEARIGLAGPAVRHVKSGDERVVTINGEYVQARVRSILPTVGNARTTEAVLVLDRPLDGIRVGDMATLAVESRVEEVGFSLPVDAITEGVRGLWACYVAEPAGDLEDGATHVLARRDLQLLRADGEFVYVRGTLASDELVAVDGIHKLTPGLPVRIEEVTR